MPPKNKKRDSRVVAPDILSYLPENIIDAIVMHLPLRDAVRTSILSKKWSWCCTQLSQIKAPKLRYFAFTGKIIFISLKGVPLLAKLSLVDTGYSEKAGKRGITKFLESFPALEHLHLDYYSVRFFAGEVPKQLRSALNSLKRLHLSDISLDELDVASCALYLTKSSPFLQEIEIEVYDEWIGPAAADVINEILEQVEGLSEVTSNHLIAVKLTGITCTDPEMELIKLLLAKSPMLAIMLIKNGLGAESPETRLKLLAEITQFQHASPKAEVVYELT
ncbi:hypothetical protein HAX54_002472 [Datura stramonium]|uniref:F-box domain-containing protein n=1 Tax=Datura stramonium TaxID=4076 RepID=A0ABS8RTI8_DATST|nr:hypothetical protein [Datura stramonium]